MAGFQARLTSLLYSRTMPRPRSQTHKVTLPEPLQTWASERMAEGGYASIDEYLRHLIRHDATRAERAALEARLVQAMESSPKKRVTKKFWEETRARLEKRIAMRQNGKHP